MKVYDLNEFISATALLFTAYSFFSLETLLKLNLTFVFSTLQIHYTMVLLGDVPVVILLQHTILGVKDFHLSFADSQQTMVVEKEGLWWQKVLSVDKALSFA